MCVIITQILEQEKAAVADTNLKVTQSHHVNRLSVYMLLLTVCSGDVAVLDCF